ncbi:ABC1 kinase family protein [Egicoccus halophilus]|uniref:Putative ATP-binding protein n=1 Tax=Egicoccus halophilus TaxID=1670830 RepID=A0A8J3ADE8_9ACTN|nr:AarF/ABC1/UbiB kinase family protein [Egicoccus halophilus]GGI04627.1 putative ATP-binding protein [Egicoccus halophilus]
MARKGLGGRIQRGSRLARTGVRGATGLAGAKARQLTGRPDADDAAHRELAEHLREVLGDMKGAAMKLGQLLSFVDLDLPPDVQNVYHEALAELRDAAPAFDPEAIDEVLREEYGAAPETVFASFDRQPLAAASIGQVHAATLDDGREVVVKVQYPGVAEAVRSDLRNLETFRPIARFVAPNQEIEPLLEELRERIDDELDYQREARYQRAFANRYAGHPFIRVPDIIGELCRRRVLVSERVRGEKFDTVAQSGDEALCQRVGEIVFRYAFGSIGRFRLFNGDPHPGNYLIEPEGSAADGGVRVAFLDYGSVKMFTRENYDAMRSVEESVAHADRHRAIDALRSAGFLPPTARVDEELVHEWFRLYTRPVVAEQPFTFTPEYAAEVIRSNTDPRSPYGDVLRKLNLPPDYLLLNRIQWGLNSVLGRLGATNDWRAIRDEYVAAGAAPATDLGRLDATWWRTREPEIDPPA